MSFALIALIAAEAVTAQPAIAAPDPKAMSHAEIRAFNAKVDRGHPYYIRCVKSEAIGSLVKRQVSCRTNEQWKEADRVGNDEVRDVMDHTRSKSWNTSG